jgi:hypothetical protein
VGQQERGKAMSHDEIRAYYDAHPNMTLAQLSRITGLRIDQLKKILMS